MLVGEVRTKKRWRAQQARAKALPTAYRTAYRGVQRYLLQAGAIAQGEVLVEMLEDLTDLFEQAVADGTAVRSLVGEDPVGFAEDFLRNYAGGQWVAKERRRLEAAIDQAEDEEASS